ncbi:MAG: hypothetical protein QW589_03620, partial [Candidatus Bathyarchaeia archaeon]
DIASYLSTLSEDDKLALRTWASDASLEKWREDPIGRIKGVGLITFQYLRMMGGIDTVMPDKIVKRVVNEVLEKAGLEPVNGDIEFIKKAEEVALACGYEPIELCWMTWLVQLEGKVMRMKNIQACFQRFSLLIEEYATKDFSSPHFSFSGTRSPPSSRSLTLRADGLSHKFINQAQNNWDDFVNKDTNR